MSSAELVLKLFFQLAVILATCRLVGLVGARFAQAQVVSEMVAGVLLGPSLLGLVAPSSSLARSRSSRRRSSCRSSSSTPA